MVSYITLSTYLYVKRPEAACILLPCLFQNVIVKDEFETLHERINDQREFYKLKVIHGGVYYQVP